MKNILLTSAVGVLLGASTMANAVPVLTNTGFESTDLSSWSFSFPGPGAQTTASNAVIDGPAPPDAPINPAIGPVAYDSKTDLSTDYGDYFLALRTPDDPQDGNANSSYTGPVQRVSRVFTLGAGDTLVLAGAAAFDWGDVIDLGSPIGLVGGVGLDAAKVELTNPGGSVDTVKSFAGDVNASENWEEWTRTLTGAGDWTLTFSVYNTFSNKKTSVGLFDMKAPIYTPGTPPPPPTGSVPEPGALTLLGLGLAGLGAARRRKKT